MAPRRKDSPQFRVMKHDPIHSVSSPIRLITHRKQDSSDTSDDMTGFNQQSGQTGIQGSGVEFRSDYKSRAEALDGAASGKPATRRFRIAKSGDSRGVAKGHRVLAAGDKFITLIALPRRRAISSFVRPGARSRLA